MPKPSSPLSVTKPSGGCTNAGKPPASSTSPPFRGRDLQSAMQHAPTIRVIHIFAPRVIKTDVANFRSTVQKLTGKGKTKSQRRAARAVKDGAYIRNDEDSTSHAPELLPQAGGMMSPAQANGTAGLYWDQQQHKDVLTLQRLVGDACGVPATELVRCNSDDSGTYSLDSGHTFSGDSGGNNGGSHHNNHHVTSPTDCISGGFSFYPRETPYSLSEIPAPFFGGHADPHLHFGGGGGHSGAGLVPVSCSLPMSSAFGVPHMGSLPTSHLMEHNFSSLGFDVDPMCTMPTLSDVASLGSCNSSSGGSLFDLMPAPRSHCRSSVQSHYQGANFFEANI